MYREKFKNKSIDDDKDINNLFKIYLEKNGRYQIDAYTDPVNALYYSKKDFMIWFYLT